MKNNLSSDADIVFKQIKKALSSEKILAEAKFKFEPKALSISIKHPKGEGNINITPEGQGRCFVSSNFVLDISTLEKITLKAFLNNKIKKING